jgi:predicted RNA-binding protein YlqC (UPF0109 family)
VSDEDFEPEEGSDEDGADEEGGVSLQELVEVVARTLADEPERVVVTETDHRGVTLVELTMAPDDLGRVIGRQGRTAAALRTLVNLAAELVGIKAQLEFHEARR